MVKKILINFTAAFFIALLRMAVYYHGVLSKGKELVALISMIR